MRSVFAFSYAATRPSSPESYAGTSPCNPWLNLLGDGAPIRFGLDLHESIGLPVRPVLLLGARSEGPGAFRLVFHLRVSQENANLVTKRGALWYTSTMPASTSSAIREATFSDASAIFALIRSYPDELVPRSKSDILQNVDRFLVAEKKKTFAGAVSWGILPELGSARHPSVEIKSLAVLKAFQKQGLGRALVQAAIEQIEHFRPEQIVTLTFSPDFFRPFGFREVPKETLMHKLYTGCLNCTRYDNPFTCPEIAMTRKVAPGPEGEQT